MSKTKIFEALEHANQSPGVAALERGRPSAGIAPPELDELMQPGKPFSAPASPLAAKRSQGGPLEKKMLLLYQGICAQVTERGRVVTFISALPGEGASGMIRQLAWVVATKLNLKVVILDAHDDPSQPAAFGLHPTHAWGEVVQGTAGLEDALAAVPDVPLYVSPVSLARFTRPVFNSQQLKGFFELLRPQFDLVLIDAPSLTISPESLALCGGSDGIVLVAEAEKTRHEVVKDLQETLLQHGGKILGVALTNRRLVVPKFVYDRT